MSGPSKWVDGKPQLTVDAVEELIRKKIFERVIPGSSILNTGFRLFGRPEHGITPEVFHRTLAHLGVILSPEDSRVIFDKYDHEGNGRLQFDKFAVNLFPKDYTQPTWNIIRDQEQWLESQQRQHALNETHKVGRGEAVLAYPKSMEKFKMSQEEIKLLLQRKIEQRARRPEVQLQVAFKMFGSPKNGLTPDSFRTVLWKLGIPVSREDCLEMFRSYDADGGGVVDFYEFIQGVMPVDYPSMSWNQLADDRQWKREDAKSKEVFNPNVTEYPAALKKGFQYKTEEIEKLLQDKLQGYARSDVEKYRKSYLVLGRPKGDITLSVFAACVRRLGIPAREDQVEELFTKYDKKGTGKIGFYELVRQILPQDYPTNSWSSMRGDEILDSEMEKLARSKKGSMKDRYKPNMSIVRPQRTSRGSTAPVQPTPRTARGGRPVSRAMAAHLNSIERMKTARGKGKLSTVKESARRAKK